MARWRPDAEIVDEHLSGALYMDKITKPGEGWFEHLKKFVDNGAAAFKLDGANQVLEHPIACSPGAIPTMKCTTCIPWCMASK